jgi:hypothetical protein
MGLAGQLRGIRHNLSKCLKSEKPIIISRGGDNTIAGYSNATMSGAWILLDSVGGDNGYFIADGNGKITDAAFFNMDNPPGNYNVGTNGSLTLTFSMNNGTEVYICTGQFNSLTHANCTVGSMNAEIVKVVDASAAKGNWTGSLTKSAAPFTQYNISFQVDANGTVTNFAGFTGPVTGKMYALASGDAVGFFRTGETNQFNQITIRGNLVVNSFTGTFGIDNGTPDDGAVSLIR